MGYFRKGRARGVRGGVASCLKLRCNSIFAGGLLDAKLVDAIFGVVGDFRLRIDELISPPSTFAFQYAGVIVVPREMSLYSVPVSCCGTKISLVDMSGKDVWNGHCFARYGFPLLRCARRVRTQHVA